MTQIRISVKVPEFVLNSSYVRFEIRQKMRGKTGPDLRKEFKRTVEGWETSPDFAATVYDGGYTSVVCHVFPQGIGTAQYVRVNEGSPAHLITSKSARGRLRFQTGYRPATRPRVIGSRSKGRFGDFVMKAAVQHPGFEGRKFDEVIAEEYYDIFAEDMQDAIKAATVRTS